jgi:antitoxin HicB
MRYVYPALFEVHPDTIIVSFRDFPEAVTEGKSQSEALTAATDCLDTALLFRLKEKAAIPEPSKAKRSELAIPASPSVAAKVAFARAFAQSKMSKSALARRLGLRETEVRRLLDPDHATKLDRLDEALRVLGRRLVIADQPTEDAA